MKRFWNIDIDNKIASFNDSEVVYKFKFEISLDDIFIISNVEILENNQKIDLSKMHSYMRYLGDEMQLLNFPQKLKYEGDADMDGVKMYKVEDNIYIDDEGTLNTLDADGFNYTDYSVDIFNDEDIESSPVTLIKMSVYEDIEDEPTFDYLTWNEFKKRIGHDDL